MALDGLLMNTNALYLGRVAEDDFDVLSQINNLYCDKAGRPYTDVRIKRALIVHDPFDDPPGMAELLEHRKVLISNATTDSVLCSSSPEYDKPQEERVEERIAADDEHLHQPENEQQIAEKEEELEKKEAKSRAVVLEMLGDIPDADVAPAENVLFVCKLNPLTNDEDLTLIFSRFDPNAKASVVRDPLTEDSLCYAFVEFTTPQQCNEAYFKMNNVLIDDRRIKVDFSQSVSKEWNRYTQTLRTGANTRRGEPSFTTRPTLAYNSRHPNMESHPSRQSRWGAVATPSTVVYPETAMAPPPDSSSDRNKKYDEHRHNEKKHRDATTHEGDNGKGEKYDRRREKRRRKEKRGRYEDDSSSSSSTSDGRHTSSRRRRTRSRSSDRHSKEKHRRTSSSKHADQRREEHSGRVKETHRRHHSSKMKHSSRR